MSDGVIEQCRKFLVVILIIFQAEALQLAWRSYSGRDCFWKKSSVDAKYELRPFRNSSAIRNYAALIAFYEVKPGDQVPGEFCITYSANNLWEVVVLANSRELKKNSDGGIFHSCASYDSRDRVKISFEVSCSRSDFQKASIEILYVGQRKTPPTSTTVFTSSPTLNDAPTTDVGDIQYVGVVVGAICIALFTLFSCLTIISARRSNQRDSRHRTVASASCPEEEDVGPDVVADQAPPSYDAVMACPDLYPPTPQDTPHATPETTPHLSLHRRALLNQHVGSLASSGSATPQLQRQSFTPTIASDEWDDIPEYPPPPYPGLANGDISAPIHENATNGVAEVENTRGEMPGVENPETSQPGSESSRISSPIQNSTSRVTGDQENPWVLNNIGNGDLRGRQSNNPDRGTTEQYPMRERTASADSSHSNRDSPEESRSDSPVSGAGSDSEEDRTPKTIEDTGGHAVRVVVAV